MDGGHEGGGGPEAVELSAYELERLANIERNEAVLVALGLLDRSPSKEEEEEERAARQEARRRAGSLNSPLAHPLRRVCVPGSYDARAHRLRLSTSWDCTNARRGTCRVCKEPVRVLSIKAACLSRIEVNLSLL
jgi:hypothetical protein